MCFIEGVGEQIEIKQIATNIAFIKAINNP